MIALDAALARYQTEVKRLYEVLEKRLAEVKAPLASPNQLNTAQVPSPLRTCAVG